MEILGNLVFVKPLDYYSGTKLPLLNTCLFINVSFSVASLYLRHSADNDYSLVTTIFGVARKCINPIFINFLSLLT